METTEQFLKLGYPQCCEFDAEGEYHDQSAPGHPQDPTDTVEKKDPTIFTVSAIAFDFDFVTPDPSKSRADEIKILLPKNKK
ncbi:MAG: hypothetical protein AAB835_01600, partial [Patescibacteria group bacterium]